MSNESDREAIRKRVELSSRALLHDVLLQKLREEQQYRKQAEEADNGSQIQEAANKAAKKSKEDARNIENLLHSVSIMNWRDQQQDCERTAREFGIGPLLPAEADAWAQENGLPSFTNTATPTNYDPMKESSWTRAQVAAWAIWRSPAMMRKVMPKSCGERSRWEIHKDAMQNPAGERISYSLQEPHDWTESEVYGCAVRDIAHQNTNTAPNPPMQHAAPDAVRRKIDLAIREGKLVLDGDRIEIDSAQNFVAAAFGPLDQIDWEKCTNELFANQPAKQRALKAIRDIVEGNASLDLFTGRRAAAIEQIRSKVKKGAGPGEAIGFDTAKDTLSEAQEWLHKHAPASHLRPPKPSNRSRRGLCP